ncbi:MAG: hypothetical protein AB1861_16340 [Cyanobacteriota bacterium]
MATDYILFIHGVTTRSDREKPEYADKLFKLIESSVEPPLKLEQVSLYWGDANKEAEKNLLGDFQDSEVWNKLWFKDFRANQLLQFVGDAALYLSRHVGSQVVDKLKKDAEKVLGTAESPKHKPGDRLHLVTHSWGTVILFDILFADRWENKEIPGHQNVMDIRQSLFGLPPKQATGIQLASIHTMGSPIAMFNLLSVNGSSHDFKPRLNELLKNLHKRMDRKLPWLNFIHPGDPVAWPLEKVMSKLVDEQAKYLDFKDVLSHKADLSDFLVEPLSQTFLALLHGGDAHGSYWDSKQVAQRITQTIRETAKVAIANR